MKDIIIAPSILAADWGRFTEDSKLLIQNGADWLHFDVMDGNFVPSISFGAGVLKSLKKNIPNTFYDVHLMVNNPINHVEEFASAGANLISFHLEASEAKTSDTIKKIKDCGGKAGIVVNPQRAVEDTFEYLSEVDLLLVMTVVAGKGGQSFMEECLDKVRAAAKFIEENNLDIRLEVDGGINHETAKLCKEAGADTLVAGSYIFKHQNMSEAIELLRK